MAIQYDHDHENEINFFAMTNFRNQQRKFGIKTDDRRRHMYLIGKTGMGKTTALENLILNDIIAGHGVGVVDPHGDMADKLLDYIPQNRINDVVYFNPADADFPMAFNVLETVNPLHKHLVAQGLMGVFKKIWPDVWSARMEHILNNCILALLDYPGSTLLGINRLLVDKNFRKRVVTKIKDPIVKAFWVDEYQVWEARFRNEAIQPIQNKVGQFLSASVIRNIVAQVKSTINPREFMDNGKIFIMNLAKGRLGEDTSRLLGGMLITKLQLAAMERVDTPEPDRRDFYLYVDEFQNFATESFANILSEARKYRLNLIVAHQYIGQLITDVSTKVRDAVFGNVGTMVLFRIGAEDAEFVAKEFSPHFIEEDMVNLTKYDVYLKLMIDGVTSNPFSATTLPPVALFQGHRDKIIRVSRERYAAEVAVIEEKVMRWSGVDSGEEEGEGLAGSHVGTRSVEPGSIMGGSTHPRSSSTRSAASLNGATQAGLRVSSAGSGQPSPAQGVEIGVGVPIVKAGLEIKPISLTEALRQRPVQIKTGPPVHLRPPLQNMPAPSLSRPTPIPVPAPGTTPMAPSAVGVPGMSASAKKRRRRRHRRKEHQNAGLGAVQNRPPARQNPSLSTPVATEHKDPSKPPTSDISFE